MTNHTEIKTYVHDKQDALVRFIRSCADCKCQIVRMRREIDPRVIYVTVLVPEDLLAAWENRIAPPVKKATGRKRVTSTTAARCPLLRKGDDISAGQFEKGSGV